ncbi:MAG: histidine phosphatase family protein [Deltaproteobacteria bacterium]|nr:histidine phosphatase family protein [Deltaproteobacteria bacterium]
MTAVALGPAGERRRLIVVRHAQSGQAVGSDDHARTLTPGGTADAIAVGRAIAALGWWPELVVSSDSARTRLTWEGLQGALGAVPVRWEPSLYESHLGAAQAALEGVPCAVSTVLVLGHNPTWERLVAWLSGVPVGMRPATAALLETRSGRWDELVGAPERWSLVQVISPR